MECLLCSIWNQMTYSKRPTTPVSAAEAEGVFIVGFWAASRQESVPRVCQRHMSILVKLDGQEEVRREAERLLQETARRATAERPIISEPYQQQIAEFQRRKQLVTQVVPQQVIPPEPIISFEMPAPPPPAPVMTAEGFELGPGPLANENTVAPHPGLVVNDAIQQPVRAQPGTIEGALEAARMPPIEGGKVMYTCPLCGDEVITGDVHAC